MINESKLVKYIFFSISTIDFLANQCLLVKSASTALGEKLKMVFVNSSENISSTGLLNNTTIATINLYFFDKSIC